MIPIAPKYSSPAVVFPALHRGSFCILKVPQVVASSETLWDKPATIVIIQVMTNIPLDVLLLVVFPMVIKSLLSKPAHHLFILLSCLSPAAQVNWNGYRQLALGEGFILLRVCCSPTQSTVLHSLTSIKAGQAEPPWSGCSSILRLLHVWPPASIAVIWFSGNWLAAHLRMFESNQPRMTTSQLGSALRRNASYWGEYILSLSIFLIIYIKVRHVRYNLICGRQLVHLTEEESISQRCKRTCLRLSLLY